MPGKKGKRAGICWVVGVCLGGEPRGLRGKVLGGVGLWEAEVDGVVGLGITGVAGPRTKGRPGTKLGMMGRGLKGLELLKGLRVEVWGGRNGFGVVWVGKNGLGVVVC